MACRDVTLSVVVPAHDEAPNLERLLPEVHAALDPPGVAWELIIVDDGSDDDTPAILAGWPPRPATAPRSACRTAAARRPPSARGCARRGAGSHRHPRRRPPVPARRVPRRSSRASATPILACGIRATARPAAPPDRVRVLELRPPLPARATPARPRVSAACVPARRAGRRRSGDAALRRRTPLVAGALRARGATAWCSGRSAHQARAAGVSKYTATGRCWPVVRELRHVLRGLGAGARAAGCASRLWSRSRPSRCLYLDGSGRWPLLEPDEGRNAEVAREMLELGQLERAALQRAALSRQAGAALLADRGRLPYARGRRVRRPAARPRWRRRDRRAHLRHRAGAARDGAARAARRRRRRHRPLVIVFARLAIFDMPLTAPASPPRSTVWSGRVVRGPRWHWWPLARPRHGARRALQGARRHRGPAARLGGRARRAAAPRGAAARRRRSPPMLCSRSCRRGSCGARRSSPASCATRLSTRRCSASPRRSASIAAGRRLLLRRASWLGWRRVGVGAGRAAPSSGGAGAPAAGRARHRVRGARGGAPSVLFFTCSASKRPAVHSCRRWCRSRCWWRSASSRVPSARRRWCAASDRGRRSSVWRAVGGRGGGDSTGTRRVSRYRDAGGARRRRRCSWSPWGVVTRGRPGGRRAALRVRVLLAPGLGTRPPRPLVAPPRADRRARWPPQIPPDARSSRADGIPHRACRSTCAAPSPGQPRRPRAHQQLRRGDARPPHRQWRLLRPTARLRRYHRRSPGLVAGRGGSATSCSR